MPQRDTHEQAVESLVFGFERDLKPIIARARREVIETLTSRLSVVDGKIANTRTNQRVLRSVRQLFERAMERAGYSELVDSYVAQFGGQFEFFDRVVKDLGETVGLDLSVVFGPRDKAFFEAHQAGAMSILDGVVERVGLDAQRQALFSVGGLKLSSLISELTEEFDTSLAEARTIADTSLSMFYRVITDRGFQIIENEHPQLEMRYRPDGPLDKLTRPFCTGLMRANRSYSRKEIDAMDNGQIPGVFASFGGFNCRHQWRLALDHE